MKKISIILLFALVLSILVGCNSVKPTEVSTRWGNEEFVFNISKADLEHTVTYNNEKFTREPVINGQEIRPENTDQVVPEDVGGTYSISIELKNGETQCTYTTQQILYAQYPTENLSKLDIWNDLQAIVVAADSEENPFTEHDGLTTLKSVTKSSVTFENTASQQPISSYNYYNGFYIGHIHQEVSSYEFSTVYNFAEKKVSVTIDGTTEERALETKVKLIDANQLLLYARSLEKTSTSFQDSPSVRLYSPLTNEIKVASFAFGYTFNTLLTGPDGNLVPAKLTAVGIVVDGVVMLVQLSLPDTVNKNANLDTKANSGSTPLNKYTTVRFRSGIISYELATYDAKILDAVKVDVPVEAED